MSDISYKIKHIISENLNVAVSDINANSTFQSLSADSLDKVELILEFENEFNISFADEETENIATVQNVINLIEHKIKLKYEINRS